eukprot:TRINITY_DN5539_c0_g1_i1.p2 TRINITY_DN5539_c0_g1~~TRINITY_DN5539_c0_g1_i1.p2  ORF type:complete len:1518 (-),score=322.70 TRINITY_DN5539_c0_g1_i1:55-4608(-)
METPIHYSQPITITVEQMRINELEEMMRRVIAKGNLRDGRLTEEQKLDVKKILLLYLNRLENSAVYHDHVMCSECYEEMNKTQFYSHFMNKHPSAHKQNFCPLCFAESDESWSDHLTNAHEEFLDYNRNLSSPLSRKEIIEEVVTDGNSHPPFQDILSGSRSFSLMAVAKVVGREAGISSGGAVRQGRNGRNVEDLKYKYIGYDKSVFPTVGEKNWTGRIFSLENGLSGNFPELKLYWYIKPAGEETTLAEDVSAIVSDDEFSFDTNQLLSDESSNCNSTPDENVGNHSHAFESNRMDSDLPASELSSDATCISPTLDDLHSSLSTPVENWPFGDAELTSGPVKKSRPRVEAAIEINQDVNFNGDVEFKGMAIGIVVPRSDRRLKTLDSPLNNQESLDAVENMETSKYEYKDKIGEPRAGIMADTVPDFLQQDIGGGFKGVDHYGITGYTVSALKGVSENHKDEVEERLSRDSQRISEHTGEKWKLLCKKCDNVLCNSKYVYRLKINDDMIPVCSKLKESQNFGWNLASYDEKAINSAPHFPIQSASCKKCGNRVGNVFKNRAMVEFTADNIRWQNPEGECIAETYKKDREIFHFLELRKWNPIEQANQITIVTPVTFIVCNMKGDILLEEKTSKDLRAKHVFDEINIRKPGATDGCPLLRVEERDIYITEDVVLHTVVREEGQKLFLAERQKLVGRRDQIELVEGMRGRNAIAVSPTGSGKTVVAILFCLEEKKRLGEKFKAVFVVDKVHLTVQQSGQFALFTDFKRVIISSEQNSSMKWEDAKRYDVIFIVAAKYKEMIKDQRLSGNYISEQVSHIIFDECHHSRKKHPYNEILKEVLARDERPQIIGLTASPGGETELGATRDKINALQRNMGEAHVIQVVKEKSCLETVVPNPTIQEVPIQFTKWQTQIFNDFNELMRQKELKLSVQLDDTTARGSKKYIKLIDKLVGNASASKEVETLKEYSSCLRVFLDTGNIDELESILKKKSTDDNNEAKLERLIQLLDVEFLKDPNFKAIVFATEKKAVESIHLSLKSRGRNFNPRHSSKGYGWITGCQGENGMSRKEQRMMIDDFKRGATNILVSTSVVEEGFDVQACNAVFYLGDITSSRSLIQARGRARKKDSTFYIMYFQEKKGELSYRKSKKQEENMRSVLKEMETDGSCPLDLSLSSSSNSNSPLKHSFEFAASPPSERTTPFVSAPHSSVLPSPSFLSSKEEDTSEKLSKFFEQLNIEPTKERGYDAILRELAMKTNSKFDDIQYRPGVNCWIATVNTMGFKAEGNCQTKKEAAKEACKKILQLLTIVKEDSPPSKPASPTPKEEVKLENMDPSPSNSNLNQAPLMVSEGTNVPNPTPSYPTDREPDVVLRELSQKFKCTFLDSYRSFGESNWIATVKCFDKEKSATASTKKAALKEACREILKSLPSETLFPQPVPKLLPPSASILQPQTGNQTKEPEVLLREYAIQSKVKEYEYAVLSKAAVEGGWQVTISAMGKTKTAVKQTIKAAEKTAASQLWNSL